MTLTFPSFGLASLIALLGLPALPQPITCPAPLAEADEADQDGAFARELMTHNPEALQSELGQMYLFALYPTRF